jgi:hypothetical protein
LSSRRGPGRPAASGGCSLRRAAPVPIISRLEALHGEADHRDNARG